LEIARVICDIFPKFSPNFKPSNQYYLPNSYKTQFVGTEEVPASP